MDGGGYRPRRYTLDIDGVPQLARAYPTEVRAPRRPWLFGAKSSVLALGRECQLRMIEDMRVRNLAPHTQCAYLADADPRGRCQAGQPQQEPQNHTKADWQFTTADARNLITRWDH